MLLTTIALAELVGSGGVTSWLNGVVGVNCPSGRVASTARCPLAVVCVISRGACCGCMCIMPANDAAGGMTPIPVAEETAQRKQNRGEVDFLFFFASIYLSRAANLHPRWLSY